MKVGFLCEDNPYDRRPQSGTTYKVREALENAGVEIINLKGHVGWFHKICLKLQRGITKITGIESSGRRSLWSVYLLTKSRDKKLEDICDVVFCPFTQIYPAILKKPYVIMADATYDCLLNYYIFNHRSQRVIQNNHKGDKISMNAADQFIFSSDWAAASAHNRYGVPWDKINVIEFGANIDEKDIIKRSFQYEGHLNLLFLGVDWKRKGGDIAVAACRWLNENNIKATLHVVGIKNLSPEITSLPYVKYHGFLNKNNANDYSKLVEIIKSSHCLLLPTIAECSAISFCEASAYGLPIFTHKTGGVPNYIENGKNGYMLEIGSRGSDFGAKIKESLMSGELERMSYTAKEVYHEKLNWNVWASKTVEVLQKAIN